MGERVVWLVGGSVGALLIGWVGSLVGCLFVCGVVGWQVCWFAVWLDGGWFVCLVGWSMDGVVDW